MYFSARVGRKEKCVALPKERHPRKKPTVSSLGIHHPNERDSFAKGRKSLIARGSRKDLQPRTDGRVPSARNSPLCLSQKSEFVLSGKRKPRIAAKRAVDRGGRPCRRHLGSSANCDLTACQPLSPPGERGTQIRR